MDMIKDFRKDIDYMMRNKDYNNMTQLSEVLSFYSIYTYIPIVQVYQLAIDEGMGDIEVLKEKLDKLKEFYE